MTSGVEIIQCNPDDPLFDLVSQRVYNGYLNLANNAIDHDLLHSVLIAIKEKEPVGRLVIYDNEELLWQEKKTMQAGNFECINDPEVAQCLLNKASEQALDAGASFLIGPLNGSTWNQYRFTTSHYNYRAFFTEQTHPDYYAELWLAAGFQTFQEYFSNEATIGPATRDPLFFDKNALTIKQLNSDNLDDDLRLLYPLCMAAFSNNPLFTAISQASFIKKMKTMKPFIKDGFSRIALSTSGEAMAAILCLPDLLDETHKTLILKTAVRHPGSGIHRLAMHLMNTVMDDARKAGYTKMIHAFMHADNKSLERSVELGGKIIRKYSLFIRACS